MTRPDLKAFQPAELPILVRENFIAKASFVARTHPGMSVMDTPDAVRVDCGLPSDTFNVAVTRDPGRRDRIPAIADEHISYFRSLRRPMAFWLFEGAHREAWTQSLELLGLKHSESYAVMLADLGASPMRTSCPTGFRIEPVHTRWQMENFGRLLAGPFGNSEEGVQVRRYYESLSGSSFHDDQMMLYLGCFREEAVSTGSLFLDGRCAGIYDLATAENYHRRGFGSFLFQVLLSEARERGYRTGVLQASPQGIEIYRRAGFQPTSEVFVFENRRLFDRS